jgi:outer membrane lipoprotein-sorting protein
VKADSTAERDQVLADWQQKLEKVESISSDFVQEKRLALFSQPLTIRGRLFIHRDGRFAWEIHWPTRYKMVVIDNAVRQWDEDTGKTRTISMRNNPAAASIHEHMSAWFSGRYLSMTNTYAITLTQRQPAILQFVPVTNSPMAKYIASVQLELRDDGAYLKRILIREGGGDATDITFVNTALNAVLPPAAWAMKLSEPSLAAPTNTVSGAPGTGKGAP